MDGETGWPLIPREGLPAPVKAARRRLPPRPSPPANGQLPFFGAETTEPSPADLAGLLAGPGRLGRMGGTARVSVPVDAAWRVHVLVAELVSRGLVVSWRQEPRDSPIKSDISGERDEEGETLGSDVEHDDTEEHRASSERNDADESGAGDPPRIESDDGNTESDGESSDENDDVPSGPRFEVLTAYSRRLNGLANFWTGAAAQLFLSGPRLRLWVAAAGEPVTGGYALGLDPAKDVAMIDAALVRAGLAGRVAADRSRYLIMGKRRLRRLAELVGERPEAAPEHLWPGAAGA